jgi:hypothetical protein
MADISDDDLDALHALVATDTDDGGVDDGDLFDRYDRLGNIYLVAQEILNIRLNAILVNPASFTITGAYSQNASANIAGLEKQLANIQIMVDRLGVGVASRIGIATLSRHSYEQPRQLIEIGDLVFGNGGVINRR